MSILPFPPPRAKSTCTSNYGQQVCGFSLVNELWNEWMNEWIGRCVCMWKSATHTTSRPPPPLPPAVATAIKYNPCISLFHSVIDSSRPEVRKALTAVYIHFIWHPPPPPTILLLYHIHSHSQAIHVFHTILLIKPLWRHLSVVLLLHHHHSLSLTNNQKQSLMRIGIIIAHLL